MICFFKFPLQDSLAGAEFHTLELAKHFKKSGRSVRLFTSDKYLLKLFQENDLWAKYIWVGWEATSRWSLLLWPLTFFVAQTKLKKIISRLPNGSTLFMQSLTEKLLLTPYCLRSTDYKLRPIWLEHKAPGRWLKLNPLLPKYLKLAGQVQVITVSNFAKERFVELGVPENNIKVIYPGVPVIASEAPARARLAGGKQSPDDRHGLRSRDDSKKFTIGILSRLDPEKGVYDFLKSIVPAAQRYGWDIVVAGDGSDKRKIKQLPIRYIGFVKDLDSFFSEITVLCYPTRVDESFGLSALEAMSRGVPVIASRRGALPELIEHKKSGFLIKKPEHWEKYLKTLSEDKNLYQNMSQSSLKRAQNFSQERMLSELDSLL